MNRNEKEKQILYEWGKNNSAVYCFQKIDKEKESYFIQRDAGEEKGIYIREYGFETLPELVKELDTLWDCNKEMQSIKKAVEVAVFKNKPSKMEPEDKRITDKNEEEKLPEFIYNF